MFLAAYKVRATRVVKVDSGGWGIGERLRRNLIKRKFQSSSSEIKSFQFRESDRDHADFQL